MTIQESAYEILKNLGNPISAKEIARIALDQGLVTSTAQDPVQSHAQTIEKNIRDDVYNKPKLIFIPSPQGRLIGLPNWDSVLPCAMKNKKEFGIKELKAQISVDLYDKIKLAEQAKIEINFDETVSLILTKGLAAITPEIKNGLMEQLNSLNSL